MHRIGVVGISWRHRRADALGTFTIPREERTARVPRLAAALGVRELVYVATCNRVEVAFDIEGATLIAVLRRRIFAELAGREPRAGEAEHALRVWQGEGAAGHLFLMAAGLDSARGGRGGGAADLPFRRAAGLDWARWGESEVGGQVRAALELSRTLGLVGPRLDRVFGEALKVAKHVRPVTEGRIGKVSLSEIAL